MAPISQARRRTGREISPGELVPAQSAAATAVALLRPAAPAAWAERAATARQRGAPVVLAPKGARQLLLAAKAVQRRGRPFQLGSTEPQEEQDQRARPPAWQVRGVPPGPAPVRGRGDPGVLVSPVRRPRERGVQRSVRTSSADPERRRAGTMGTAGTPRDRSTPASTLSPRSQPTSSAFGSPER